MTLRAALEDNGENFQNVTLNVIYQCGDEHIFTYTGYVVTPLYLINHLPDKIIDSQIVRIKHGNKWGINKFGQIVKIDAELYIMY